MLNVKRVLFQTIQFSVNWVSISKTVLFQAVQFSISTQFSSIWPIDRTLSGTTTPRQSGLRSDGNEGVLCIPQGSGITGTSPSYCLFSYSGLSLARDLTLLQSSSRCNLQPSGQFFSLDKTYFLFYKPCYHLDFVYNKFL